MPVKKDEKAYLGWILENNANKDFVQRILKPKESPTLDLGDGNIATHKMAWEQQGGKYYAFPTIQRQGNGLIDKGKNAFFEAMTNGEFIEFGTPGEAEYFSKNYKKFWELD